MHVPRVQTPGVRHSFTSAGEKSRMAGWTHFPHAASIIRLRASQLRGQGISIQRGHRHPGKGMRSILFLGLDRVPFSPELTSPHRAHFSSI